MDDLIIADTIEDNHKELQSAMRDIMSTIGKENVRDCRLYLQSLVHAARRIGYLEAVQNMDEVLDEMG